MPLSSFARYAERGVHIPQRVILPEMRPVVLGVHAI